MVTFPACSMLKGTKFSIYDLILILGFAIYVSIWSFISLTRFYSLQADVFDLGYKMQIGWNALYHPFFGIVIDISHLIVYFSFPLFLFKSYPLLLIFQSFFIGVAVFPIYSMITSATKSKLIALLVGLIYLLYPLNIGLNWYDFHFMMFFPTLFIFGYFFFLRKNYKTSTFMFILSGLTTYPFLGFSLIFGIVFLIDAILREKKNEIFVPTNSEKKYLFLLVCFSFIILVIQFHIMGITPNMISKKAESSVNTSANLISEIFSVLFVLLIGGFSALIKPKWLIFFIPYIFLVFYSNNYVFQYPRIMQFQYGPLVTPFIFLALSDLLSIHSNKQRKVTFIKKISIGYRSNKLSQKVVAIFLLVVVTTSALLFNPLSPINKDSGINFEFYQKDVPNFTLYNDMKTLISLVPASNPYLMVQQNMPEAYPRPFYPNVGILSVGGGAIAYNSSNNNFYVYNTALGWINADIQYVLYDPFSQWAIQNGSAISGRAPEKGSTYQSMYNMVNELLASGSYGILAEANGMVLLEKDFFGGLEYYIPLNDQFTVNNNNIINEVPGMWKNSAFTFISPGSYRVKLIYDINENYKGNISFSATGNNGETVIFKCGRSVNFYANSSVSLSFNFTEKYTYLYTDFSFPTNSAYFLLKSFELCQVGQPSNNEY